MSENEIRQIIKDESVYAQKFWALRDILIKKAHENYDKIDEDAVYEVDLECIFRQFMADEFEHCREEDLKSLQVQGAENLHLRLKRLLLITTTKTNLLKRIYS